MFRRKDAHALESCNFEDPYEYENDLAYDYKI